MNGDNTSSEDGIGYMNSYDNIDGGIEFPPYTEPPPPYSPPKPPHIIAGESPPPYTEVENNNVVSSNNNEVSQQNNCDNNNETSTVNEPHERDDNGTVVSTIGSSNASPNANAQDVNDSSGASDNTTTGCDQFSYLPLTASVHHMNEHNQRLSCPRNLSAAAESAEDHVTLNVDLDCASSPDASPTHVLIRMQGKTARNSLARNSAYHYESVPVNSVNESRAHRQSKPRSPRVRPCSMSARHADSNVTGIAALPSSRSDHVIDLESSRSVRQNPTQLFGNELNQNEVKQTSSGFVAGCPSQINDIAIAHPEQTKTAL